ncbi:MAG: hypothetical protein ABIO57_03715 [Candidatus Paceibacterota bacterium]
MKPVYHDYDNKTYVEYLDEAISILIMTGDQETMEKLASKLSGVHSEIFWKIIGYKTLQRIAKAGHAKVYSENQYDFERLHEFRELKTETDSLYEEYLALIEPAIFLEAIANIAYQLARLVLKKQVVIHIDFLKAWLEWHMYLTNKNKNKRKGEKIKEKLRAILGDKIDDFEKIQQEYSDNMQRVKEGRANLFVNIDKEVMTDDCPSHENLFLPRRLDASDILVVEEHTKCVEIEGQIYSLRDYYEIIENKIDQSWLQSTDLLKRIIIVYLIKKCQNGDEKAFNKLFSFYVTKAEHLAVSFIRHKAQGRNKLAFSEGGNLSESAAKSAIWTIMEKLLRGDNPTNIYKYLDKNRNGKKGVDFLNKRPYAALEESYGLLFQLVNNQYNMLVQYQSDLIQSTKDPLHRHKTAKKSSTRKQYMQSLFRISQHYLRHAEYSSTIFTMFDPLALLSISTLHNKNLFNPTNKGNLTIWLFGVKGVFPGKLMEGLNDWFKANTKTKNGKRIVPEDDY